MTQRNRAKVEVETLEDRITPSGCSGIGSGWWQSQIHSQLAYLKAKINSAGAVGWAGTPTGVSNGSSHAHSTICSALDQAYAKLVAMKAPQSVLSKVAALQAKFGCNSSGQPPTLTSYVCSALDQAYAKLVAMNAPQSVLSKVAALQAKFGCNSSEVCLPLCPESGQYNGVSGNQLGVPSPPPLLGLFPVPVVA